MCFCWQGAADPRRQDITAFEQTCLESADPMLFLDAIMTAECPGDMAGGGSPSPSPLPAPAGPAVSPIKQTVPLKLFGLWACSLTFWLQQIFV